VCAFWGHRYDSGDEKMKKVIGEAMMKSRAEQVREGFIKS
jgi:hypothetical protein